MLNQGFPGFESHQAVNNFSPLIPQIIKRVQTIFIVVIGSLNSNIPNTTVPIVPIPVQIAYAVPRGKFFSASAKNKNLKSYKLWSILTE